MKLNLSVLPFFSETVNERCRFVSLHGSASDLVQVRIQLRLSEKPMTKEPAWSLVVWGLRLVLECRGWLFAIRRTRRIVLVPRQLETHEVGRQQAPLESRSYTVF